MKQVRCHGATFVTSTNPTNKLNTRSFFPKQKKIQTTTKKKKRKKKQSMDL